MIDFVKETLLLLPFLFVTYLVLEAVEAHAGGALERWLERAKSVGPLAGALAGAIPQCGVSAAAASLYAGGVVTVGTLVAVFLSTSDELIPVLISKQMPAALMVKIVAIKVAAAIAVGFSLNAILAFARHIRRPVAVHDLCAHSHCGCHEHKGILVPALIHTAEIFIFIVVVSGAIELAMLIPNCAVSVAGAELYCKGAMSAGALMSSSFAGSGLGLLVLFRTNRNLKENLAILAVVYVVGVALGWLTGHLI